MSDQTAPKSGLAIAGLVLGIIGLCISWVPILNNLAIVPAILGAIFAIIALLGIKKGKKSGKGLGIAGLVCSILAVIIIFASQAAYSAAIDKAAESLNTDATAATSSESKAEGSDAKSEEQKYAVADEQVVDKDYMTYITGTFTNKSGEKLNSVLLTYNLYDADGNQIGTATASTSNLDADKSWKFEAMAGVDKDKIAKFELSEVNTF